MNDAILWVRGKVGKALLRPMRWKTIRADKLHLACGPNVLEGWANIDIERKHPAVLRLDLTQKLPVQSESVEYVYCEHFIEHIPRSKAIALLRECHRTLKTGGVLRLSTPDLQRLMKAYVDIDLKEWANVGWLPRTPCQLINEGMRNWGHEFLYDREELKGLLLECGYTEIVDTEWRQSKHAALRGLESRPFHGEIILEARK